MPTLAATFCAVERDDRKPGVFSHHRARLRRWFGHQHHLMAGDNLIKPGFVPDHVTDTDHGLQDQERGLCLTSHGDIVPEPCRVKIVYSPDLTIIFIS